MMKEKTKEVKFDSIYYDWIREGRKRQTIRTPPKRWDVTKGDIVTAHFTGSSKTLQLMIEKTGYKSFKNLSNLDAELEGFDSVGELKDALLIYYPNLIPENRVYYYRFHMIK